MESLKGRQISILIALIIALGLVIFHPLWETLYVNLLRGPTIRSEALEVMAPATWRSRVVERGVIEMWLPCKSVFCTTPESSLRVYLEPNLVGRKEEWLLSAREHMSGRSGWVEDAQSAQTSLGEAVCLLSHGKNDSHYRECLCMIVSGGIMAGFAGAERELTTFHQILKSSRIHK